MLKVPSTLPTILSDLIGLSIAKNFVDYMDSKKPWHHTKTCHHTYIKQFNRTPLHPNMHLIYFKII